MPGIAASSASLARASAPTPVVAGEGLLGQLHRAPAAAARAPDHARSAPPPTARRARAGRAAHAAARRRAGPGPSASRGDAPAPRPPDRVLDRHPPTCRWRRAGGAGRGVPGTRTTEARRFPPPSGPGNTPNARDGPLPGDSPAASPPALCAAASVPRAGSARGRRAAATQQHLDRVERPVEPDRGVQRPARAGTPSRARAPTGSRATNENSARCAPAANEASNSVSDVGDREEHGAPHDRRPRADARAQAVVANPRKNSSSPIGASTAAETQVAQRGPPRPRPRAAGSASARGTAPAGRPARGSRPAPARANSGAR